MVKKVVNDAAEAMIAAQKLMDDITKFVEKNIVKVDVKVTEGPMLKEARKMVAQGLKNVAKMVEDPSAEIKWVDIKKPKQKK
ncbi:MAG: hypothetical protein WC307_03835 [Candidatus Nanoarchaeia archaeon]|jgi:hypothetical protein